jgi:ferredoxin-type protein NapG
MPNPIEETPEIGSKEISSRSRREFMSKTARTACGMSLVGLVLGIYSEAGKTHPFNVLRPPGAWEDENKFLGLCVRCGLCVRACPYDCLKLAKFGEPTATGTPYYTAEKYPCYMCQDIPCVKACPTAALDPKLTDIRDARMGVARVVGTDRCLNYWFNHRCLACTSICPVYGKDRAITLEKEIWVRRDGTKQERFIPTVHDDNCTGCGLCEMTCPTAIYAGGAAIKVVPLTYAKQVDKRYHRRLTREEEKAMATKTKAETR